MVDIFFLACLRSIYSDNEYIHISYLEGAGTWNCSNLDPGHFTQTCWYLGSGCWPASHVIALPAPDIELHLLHLLHLDDAVPGILLYSLALL